MTTKNVSIRIVTDGKAQVKNDFAEIAQSGQAQFGQLGKAIGDATGELDRQKRSFDNLVEAQRRAQEQAQAQAKYNAQSGIDLGGAGTAQASARVFQDYEQRAANLRAQIDPLGAAQLKMNAAISDADALLAAGTIKETEHTAAVALAQKTYKETAAALAAMGTGEALSAFEARELGEGFLNMAHAAASGELSFARVTMAAGDFIRAGGRNGGLLGVLEAAGAGLASLLTPTVLLVGGIATLAATAGAAYYGYLQDQEALKSSIMGLGKASGATIDQMEQIAETSANAGNISVGSARDIEEAFAQTGRIGVRMFGDLIAITRDYAAATNEDMDQAKKDLAAAFADPAKGADALDAKLGFLDDKTRQYIVTLAKQNDLTGAQRALLDALRGNLDDASDHVTDLGLAWQYVERHASDAWDWMKRAAGEVANGPSLTEQLAALQSERAAAQQGIGKTYVTPGAEPVTDAPRPLADIDADIAKVKAAIKGLEDDASRTARDRANATESKWLGDLGRAVDADVESYKDLKIAAAQAAKDIADPKIMSHVADLKEAKDAADAYARAVSSYLSPAQKAQALNALDIQALDAKTPKEKAAIAAKREEIDLAGKVVTTAQAHIQIQLASAKAYAEATHAIEGQTQAANDNAQAWIAVADAYLKGSAAGELAEESGKKLADQIGKAGLAGAKQVAQLQYETQARSALNAAVADGTMTAEQASRAVQLANALAPLEIAYDIAKGEAKAELKKIIDALTAAYKNNQAAEDTSAAQKQVEASARNVDLLKQELMLQGDGDSARAIEIAVLQKKQQLLEQNIDAQSAEGKQILANTADAERLNQQLQLAQASRGELEGLFDSVTGRFAQFIVQGKLDWKDFAQAGIAALQDIEGEMLKLAVLNPLKNLIFGTNLPTLGSVGGILGSLFGTGSSAATDFGGFGVAAPFAGGFHLGGEAGFASTNRVLPENVIRFAPRLHSGAYLAPNEFPAVLELGERVLNRRETKAYNRGAYGGVTLMPGAIQIVTPNPGAFHASSGQIVAKLAGAVAQGAARR